jgi:hypothetical protein
MMQAFLRKGLLSLMKSYPTKSWQMWLGGGSTCQLGVCGFKWCGWWLFGTVWSPVSLNGL